VSGYVAVLVIHLHFPGSASLKAKRKELAPVKAHLRGKLGISLAEVDHHDTWQRTTLTAALAGRSLSGLQETADGVERYLESRFPEAGVRLERLVVSVDELRGV
jgi:uncharacterized protein YlxP (DUF503 family)